jgi:hypothetical protein
MRNKKIFLVLSAIIYSNLFAQVNPKDDKTIVSYPEFFGISKPLTELFVKEGFENKLENKESGDKKNRKAQNFIFSPKDGAKYANDEYTIQREQGKNTMAAPIKNWAGQSSGGGCPLDPSGAVGTKHYIQAINSSPFKIFDKNTGNAIGSVKEIGDLWSPAIKNNQGDPIVLYDKYADRWLISQFGSPSKIYIAISKTNDPTGSYYTYTFNVGDSFPDYFKLSIWQDGYYMTSNGTGFVNVFEREKMLIGDAKARVLNKGIKIASNKNFWCPLPADADGVLPPADSPCPLIYYTDNNWGGSNKDAIVIHNMKTVWTGTPNLTVSDPITIPVGAFDSTYNSSWNDVEQGVGGQKLDANGGALMFRSQWRKWTGYNSLLACWTVKIKDGVHSTKWVEMRQDQSTKNWSLYQDGIYAPDGLSRWVASMAMDDNGNIGLSYAVAGKTPVATSPSLRYTGRLKNDPLGKMTFAEVTAVAGSGSSNCGNRMGDYAHTSLDPDGLTFWHTGMYFSGGGGKSRIYSFKIPSLLGVAEFNSEASFNIHQYQGQLNIKVEKLESDKDFIVNLFDLNGKQVFEKNIKNASSFETSFDVSKLSKGIYLVRIGNIDFQKVVKISIE